MPLCQPGCRPTTGILGAWCRSWSSRSSSCRWRSWP
jgi:hypothetical protein